jgi:hypothetical protein
MNSSIICSYSSLKVNEPLPGTAPRGEIWMLLEYDGIWGRKALEESKLPQPVKSRLHQLREQIPSSKLLLIRQHLARRVAREGTRLTINHSRQGIQFFLALATQQDPLLYDFRLENYEDLLDLDILGAVARQGIYNANISRQTLTLICTNGRRDWCCARYGPDIYQAIVQTAEESTTPLTVWQSSHLGGHRFAPNIACFPEGLFYGRIEKNELQIFLDHVSQRQFYTTKARGRACYPAPVQAAEILLRQRTGLIGQGDYKLMHALESRPGEWVVDFRSLHTGQTHSLKIIKDTTSEQVYKSCNDPVASPLVVYRLVE